MRGGRGGWGRDTLGYFMLQKPGKALAVIGHLIREYLTLPCMHIFRLTRANQVYNFPVNLSEEIHPAAIFYGTVVPITVFWVVKTLIVNPFLKMEKEK